MKRNLVLFGLLVLVAATLVAPAPVQAQGVTFVSSGLPRQVRVEGRTETLGEVVLLANNNGTILAGSSITIIYGTAGQPAITNPAGQGPVVTCSPATCAANITTSVSGNSMTISFGPADVPFAALTDTVVISQARANIAALGTGTTAVNATLSGVSANPVTNPITFTQPSVQVAVIISPATTEVFASSGNILTCQPPAAANPLGAGPFVALAANQASIRINESAPASLTTEVNEETFTPIITAANVTGTQVVVAFTNVPAGLSVAFDGAYVPGTLAIPAAGDLNATFTVSPATGEATSTGAVTFTFTLTDGNTGAAQSIVLLFSFFDADADLVLVGGSQTVSAAVSLAPTDDVSPFTIISFSTSLAPQASGSVLIVADCVTNLLFPFVANIAGFDFGYAFANTSSDDPVFGTGAGATAQAGPCVVHFFPSGGGASVNTTTASIAAGGTGTLVHSGVTSFAGQSGYSIAVCQFLGAHGFGFLTDNFGVGAPATAQGYLALVIPGGRVIPAVGESLGH